MLLKVGRQRREIASCGLKEGQVLGCYVHDNEYSSSLRCGEFLRKF
jgi:hypothetical protein